MATRRLDLFNVIERDGMNKPYWQKIGAAFENKDGSYSLVFDSFPAGTGRVQMREPYDETRDGGGGGDRDNNDRDDGEVQGRRERPGQGANQRPGQNKSKRR